MSKALKIYDRIIKKDLVNKNRYKKEIELPSLIKITLHMGCKTQDFKIISKSVFILEMLSGQRAELTVSKKQNLFFKTKKHSVSGALVVLKKEKMRAFYSYLVTEVFPKIKKPALNFSKTESKSLTWTISGEDFTSFEEIDFNSNILRGLPDLNVSFIFNKNASTKEQKLLLELLNFQLI